AEPAARLARQPAAVDDEIRAGDEGRPIAGEEDGGVGYVLRSAESRPGGALALVLQARRVLGEPPGSGDDLAGGNAVAHDELLRIVDGNLARDVDRPGLAHPVRQVSRGSHDALLGAQVDEAPPDLLPWFLRDHLLYRALATVEHARQVDAHDLLPLSK